MSPQRAAPILAAYSPSAGREPVEFGLAASQLTKAPLTVVVVRPGGPMASQFVGAIEDSPDDARAVEHLRLDLDRQGHKDVEIKVLETRTIGGGLNEAVRELKPMLVVLGASSRGKAGTVMLGSKAEGLIHDEPCPVAVVPKGYRRDKADVRAVGAAFGPDGDDAEVLRSAAALAQAGGVPLKAIVVTDDGADAEAQVREALGAVAGQVDLDVDVRSGDAGDGIVAAAGDVGLLVIGSRGRGARRAALLGSVSRKVTGDASCPVLVLPRDAMETSEILIGSVGQAATD
jgi:nucleotide-binding universal stress UspA family protein